MAKPIITIPQAPLLDRGLLLDQIPQFDMSVDVSERWLNEGVTWQPRICGRDMETTRVLATACEDDFFEDDPIRECNAFETQAAFTIKDRLKGTNLDLNPEELVGLLADRFAEMTSWIFADVLTSIVAGMNTLPSAASAPAGIAFGSAATPLYSTLGVIEAEFGERMYGRSGFIHLTPGLLANAIENYGVEWRDGRYRTPVGNVVVVDPGFYNADAPTGQAAAAATEEWVYASGQIAYQTSDLDLQEARQRPGADHNTITAFAQAHGILVFDSCPVTAVLTSYDPA